MREYGRLWKDSKHGGRGKSRELGIETTHFKLTMINKRVLKPCDSKVLYVIAQGLFPALRKANCILLPIYFHLTNSVGKGSSFLSHNVSILSNAMVIQMYTQPNSTFSLKVVETFPWNFTYWGAVVLKKWVKHIIFVSVLAWTKTYQPVMLYSFSIIS